MNIMYRPFSELKINERSIEERIKFYEDNIYDNIYFISDDNKLTGYLNFDLDKNRTSPIKKFCIDKDESLDKVKEIFINNPGIYRFPVVCNQVLIGEYYDANTLGRSLYKKIEDRCLELLEPFRLYLEEWLKNKKVRIIGNVDTVNKLKKLFSTLQLYDETEVIKDFIIIDTIFEKHFRKILDNNYNEYYNLSEILISILITQISHYFKKRNIHFYVANGVRKSNLTYLSTKEKENLTKTIEQVINDSDYIEVLYNDDKESKEFINRHTNDLNQLSRIVSNGIHNVLLDVKETGFNIINGKRVTTDIPKKYTKTLHIFGPCVVQGLCVVDSNTIPSILQRKINDFFPNYVRVVNYGLAYGKDLLNDLLIMMSTDFKNGDLVVWLNGYSNKEIDLFNQLEISLIDCISGFFNKHNWFLNNPFHCTTKGNFIFSNSIFKRIRKVILYDDNSNDKLTNYIRDEKINLSLNPMNLVNSKEMENYLNYLKNNKMDINSNSKIGAVVINANPCTNGHIYLISEALKVVDFLYIFLVEESKNSIAYIDREYMLKNNLSIYKNVKLLSGGYVMTSEIAFPEYFNRNEKHDHINPALHLEVFAKKVAPFLDIKYRFFGDELDDYITNELNNTAKIYLEKNGIKVIIIPRKKNNEGVVISAKIVRQLYKEKKYIELAKYVPKYTYKRLLELNRDFNEKSFSIYEKL